MATTWKFGISDPGTGLRSVALRASSAAPAVLSSQTGGRASNVRRSAISTNVPSSIASPEAVPAPGSIVSADQVGVLLEQPAQPLVRPAPVVDRGRVVDLHAVRRAEHATAGSGDPAQLAHRLGRDRRSARAPACTARRRSSRPRRAAPRRGRAARRPDSRPRPPRRTRRRRRRSTGSTASRRSRRRARGPARRPSSSAAWARSQPASAARTTQVGDERGGLRRSAPGQVARGSAIGGASLSRATASDAGRPRTTASSRRCT